MILRFILFTAYVEACIAFRHTDAFLFFFIGVNIKYLFLRLSVLFLAIQFLCDDYNIIDDVGYR